MKRLHMHIHNIYTPIGVCIDIYTFIYLHDMIWPHYEYHKGISLFDLYQYLILKLFCNSSFIHSVSSVAQLCLTLQPHGLQHAKPPCPSPTPRVYSNSYPLSQWCHPAISSSVIPFSSCLQSLPASGSLQMSQFFASGGQSLIMSAAAAAAKSLQSCPTLCDP